MVRFHKVEVCASIPQIVPNDEKHLDLGCPCDISTNTKWVNITYGFGTICGLVDVRVDISQDISLR